MQSPAPYATLNSITDNPVYGDERNFVRARITGESSAIFDDDVDACPGQAVDVLLLFENAAADNLAGSAATIHGLSERLISGGEGTGQVGLGVMLSAKNAISVWDGFRVHCSSSQIQLTYVPGTAKLFSWFTPEGGLTIPDDGFEAGGVGLIGSKSADGELGVGYDGGKYLGQAYILFKVLVTDK